MKLLKLAAAACLSFAAQFATADGIAAAPKANAFAGDYPVYMQTCNRQSQSFYCNPIQQLAGYDNVTQSNMITIMTNGGCEHRNNLIFVCMLDSQFGKVFGGTTLVWAVVYGTATGVINSSTPVSTIYAYVLN